MMVRRVTKGRKLLVKFQTSEALNMWLTLVWKPYQKDFKTRSLRRMWLLRKIWKSVQRRAKGRGIQVLLFQQQK
ncbi:hypothetical protein LINGRAHAP2_LOCUS14481 [Linum grandiflorum]